MLDRPATLATEDHSLTGDASEARSTPRSAVGLIELEQTSRAHMIGTLAVIVLPFVAFVVAIGLLWQTRAVGAVDIGLLVAMHVVAGFGITVGFHRMLTHRSFEAKPWLRGTLTAFGSLAIEGRPTHWVADHRRHHAYSDEEGDPHSPHVGHGDGFWGTLKGAWHAHIGWFLHGGQTSTARFAPDLLKDRAVMAVDRRFGWFVLLALAIPGALGFLLTGGSWWGALTGMFWGGAVRIFITHHVTWSVNSICHMFGRRPFGINDMSTNNWLLAIPTLGESWHHNHHAFPTSAFHGLKRWQKALDPSGWVVLALEKTGLIWNVRRVSEAQMAAKLKSAAAGQ